MTYGHAIGMTEVESINSVLVYAPNVKTEVGTRLAVYEMGVY